MWAALALLAWGAGRAEARDAGPGARALRARWERSFALPAGLSLEGAQVVPGANGRTFIAQTTGLSQVAGQPSSDAACTLVVVDDAGARALSYRYRGGATGCVALAAAADGGVFVRGARLMVGGRESAPGDVTGFTAYLDTGGREVWALDDQVVVDAEPVAQNGTGAFGASYEGPQPPLVIGEASQRVLAISRARLPGAGDPQMTRVHVMDAAGGVLRQSGLGFELGGGSAAVSRAVSREASADFLVQTQTADGLNPEFFVYNGRRGIDRLQLSGSGWSSAEWAKRAVRELAGSQNGYTYILSELPGRQADEITAVDAQGVILWRVARGGPGDWQIDGRVLSMVVGPAYILVYYADDAGPSVQILDASSGEVLGGARLSEVSDFGVVGLWGRADGSAVMLTTELGKQIVHEFRLDVVGELGQTEPDAGVSDAGPEADAADNLVSPATGSPEGCAAGRRGADAPLSPAGLAFGLLVITIAARRDAARRGRQATLGDLRA